MISRAAIEAGEQAMRARRAELQHAPLDRIYGELLTAGLSAALAAEGMALVPSSPSPEMCRAGLVRLVEEIEGFCETLPPASENEIDPNMTFRRGARIGALMRNSREVKAVYAAMLKAAGASEPAPPATAGKEG